MTHLGLSYMQRLAALRHHNTGFPPEILDLDPPVRLCSGHGRMLMAEKPEKIQLAQEIVGLVEHSQQHFPEEAPKIWCVV
jgi:hypothetical protein